MYIFFGIEIPKTWIEWPSSFGKETRNIKIGSWEIDVPNIGGEPVLYKNKAVQVGDYQLTLYRYPHDQEDIEFQENLGVLGFLVCEIDSYSDPTIAFRKYAEWNEKYKTMTNFEVMLKLACKGIDFTFVDPKLLSCDTTCHCCR